MRIVTVCVNYRRQLSVFLNNNSIHDIPVSVITSSYDDGTRGYCARYSIDFATTDSFYYRGANFNKGAAINDFLCARASKLDWVLLIDCDCILPRNFHDILSSIKLNQGVYYGCRRRIDPLWKKHGSDRLDEDWSQFPILEVEEGCPGYFQLFHIDSPQLKKRPIYPTNSPTAAVSDNDFGNKFGNENMIWLNMEVLHLGEPFQNWDGLKRKMMI